MEFDWIEFYQEFAKKLLVYKENREELIEKIKSVYIKINMKLPSLESNNEIVDIDPFTVFGLFNKGITDANRIKIIKGIADEFRIEANVPSGFLGVPVLDNLKATFYAFKEDRDHDDINNLWDLFESAIKLSNQDTETTRAEFSKYYDRVHRQMLIRWNITIALYWIRPYSFINLDSINRVYITDISEMPFDFVEKIEKIKNDFPKAEEYLSIRDACSKILETGEYSYKSFPELSYTAWMASKQIPQKISEKGEKGKSNAACIRWFKPLIQALRDLGGSGTPSQAEKKIIENENLSEKEVSVITGKNKVNKFGTEVRFARAFLVWAGYIDKSEYGIWKLTDAGWTVEMDDELVHDIYWQGTHKDQKIRNEQGAALADEDVDSVRYWIYSPGENSCMWEDFYSEEIMAIGWSEIGDLRKFSSKDAMKIKMREVYNTNLSYMNSAHATWQFANEMKVGDIIFAKKGLYKIIGRGVVTSDYEYDEERSDGYKNIRSVHWTHKGEWDHPGKAVSKTLTDITPYNEYLEKIKSIFASESEEDSEEESKVYPLYTKENFLDDVFMSEEDYVSLVNVLKMKKNIVLQGAPGVGKTFAAKRLAYSIMGVKDIDRVEMVQFHQSYSYEDFIMGFRPTEKGFELKKGVFYNFCKKAEIDSDNEYFFIIDEINRGNLSKIFGELFMLIENDKRGIGLQLLYSDEKFAVPANVYIIGMMNTADRSLAMLDYALRRRFAFFELKPGFQTAGFYEYKMSLGNQKFNQLIQCVENLNEAITEDDSLGEGFCVGHSYFCNIKAEEIDDQRLYGIVEFELIPLLKEYWFDEPAKVRDWTNNLRKAIK